MDKRERILKAMQTLIIDHKGVASSVSDIAKEAGIGKGSIYYYFTSKEEILDALVEKIYGEIIQKCEDEIQKVNAPAPLKMAYLFQNYTTASVNNTIDAYLHEPQNASIHQKSLAKILSSVASILSSIIIQGVEEKVFDCDYPQELAEIILSEFCFVFDPGIFTWTKEQMMKKLFALAQFMERSLLAPAHSFDFLLEPSLYHIDKVDKTY